MRCTTRWPFSPEADRSPGGTAPLRPARNLGVYRGRIRLRHLRIAALGKSALLALFVLLGTAPALRAQGGPPMITDDPGTPGDRHWEINIAWTDQRTPGETLIGIPQIDANYGVGDRIQLNYQGSWNILRESDGPAESGLSDSQLAVKWRFYDAGDTGFQLSTYPRVFFLNPGDSDRRGTAGPNTDFLLPFEVVRNFGALSLDVDFGHTFSAASSDRGWMGGVCVGHNVTKEWELDAEVHFSGSEDLDRGETVVNLGTRCDLSRNTTLLVALGKDVRNSLGPKISLLTYLGIQIRI